MKLVFSNIYFLTFLYLSQSDNDLPCSCSSIVIESSGDAATAQENLMGVYTRSGGDYNDRPTWTKEDGEDAIIFYGCQDEGCCMTCWNVGPRTPVKMMTSDPTSEPCPYDGSNWRYWYMQAWHTDETLKISCIQEQPTSTKDPDQSTTSHEHHTTETPEGCPAGWLDAREGGMGCLFAGVEYGNLVQADVETLCADLGAHSLEILNKHQMDYIIQIMAPIEVELIDSGLSYVWWWLGLNDNGHDMEWVWPHSGQVATFHHWDIGEPAEGEEYNCVQMESTAENDGLWITMSCVDTDTGVFPICQKLVDPNPTTPSQPATSPTSKSPTSPPPTTSPPSPAPTTSPSSPAPTTSAPPSECASGWINGSSVGMSCLYLAVDHGDLNQEAVELFCAELGAHTVEIWNQQQMDFLVNAIKPVEQSMIEDGYEYVWWWLGLNDNGQDGDWVWPFSGKPATYFHWDMGEPTHGEKANCVQLESAVEWDAVWITWGCKNTDPNIFPICQK